MLLIENYICFGINTSKLSNDIAYIYIYIYMYIINV